jgi:hypothetical protein
MRGLVLLMRGREEGRWYFEYDGLRAMLVCDACCRQ